MAKKKIYPSLWFLFRDKLLPQNTKFVGYARSQLSVAELREKAGPWAKPTAAEAARYDEFWAANHYVKGSYDTRRDFELLEQAVAKVAPRLVWG